MKNLSEMDIFMKKIDEEKRKVLLQDLKRLDLKKESLAKQLRETNREIHKIEKKLKEIAGK